MEAGLEHNVIIYSTVSDIVSGSFNVVEVYDTWARVSQISGRTFRKLHTRISHASNH